MGTSTTNCHAYDIFVHRVPIIIACNDWVELTSKIEKESDKEWLESNSVLIVVLEKCIAARQRHRGLQSLDARRRRSTPWAVAAMRGW